MSSVVIQDGNYINAPHYSGRGDVEILFGKANVEKWADVDNENSTAFIANRIAWANHQAWAYINARLEGGIYSVPFEPPFPPIIVEMSARHAGVLLYDSRGLEDTETTDHLYTNHRDRVAEMLTQILAGQLKLNLPTREHAPKVVIQDLEPRVSTGDWFRRFRNR